MKKDKNVIFLFELSLSIILLLTLKTLNNPIFLTTLILIVFTYAAMKIFDFKKAISVKRKNVTYILTAFAILYVLVLYALGSYFGFYTATVKISIRSILNFILPLTIIIITTEYIRQSLLFQEVKYNNLLILIPMILVDMVIYIGKYDITELKDFLTVVGYVLFASIANNLLFNYISVKYGKIPNIIYRLITTLYVYIIPITPDVHVLIHTLIKLLFPYVIYMVLVSTYSKDYIVLSNKTKKKNRYITILLTLVMVVVTMLVSCKFKYGILVIASESMTGTINKGDAIIYEQYKGQKIKNQQIIVFKTKDKITIHRVVEVKNVNNQKRYYTKGDANSKNDDGYITDAEVMGIYKLKINQIGYLTLLVNNMFKK